MITVDCSEALAIKDRLLVYVADKLKALPILKSDGFILTQIDESQNTDKSHVLYAIAEFLESVNLSERFNAIVRSGIIVVEQMDGKEMKRMGWLVA